MDYTDIYTFSEQIVGGGGGGGGIPLFLYGIENENTQYGGTSLLYFPGGLFVNSYEDDNDDNNKEVETIDPFSIKVFEDYDMFLELVSISPNFIQKQNQNLKQRKNKTKKIIFKKKNKYSKKG